MKFDVMRDKSMDLEFEIATDGDGLKLFVGLAVGRSQYLNSLATQHHNSCDPYALGGCKIDEADLINRYGSLEAARLAGHRVRGCAALLGPIYKELQALQGLVFNIQYLFDFPESASYRDDQQHWQAPPPKDTNDTGNDVTGVIPPIQ